MLVPCDVYENPVYTKYQINITQLLVHGRVLVVSLKSGKVPNFLRSSFET